MLVLDLGARLPEPSADANDQFGQVRSLRAGSLGPVRAVWQPCGLCRGGSNRQGREEASGLALVMTLAARMSRALGRCGSRRWTSRRKRMSTRKPTPPWSSAVAILPSLARLYRASAFVLGR